MGFLNKINIGGISLYSIIFITFGTFLYVLGIKLFITPANLIPTGFTGISYELSYILQKTFNINITYNILYFILNIPIIIFGLKKIGNKFVIKTVISIILFTIFAQVIPSFSTLPLDSSGDLLISGLLAGILMGTGVGLMLRVGGSAGGTDIIAVYISLFKGKPFGVYSLIMNTIVIMLAFIITQDVRMVAITLIHLFILNSVIDMVHTAQEKRTLVIFTNHADEIKENIYSNFYRGITIIDSYGGYSGSKNKTMIISISYGELYQMTKIIKEADPGAFINVIKTDSIIGNFNNPYQKML